MLGPLQAISPGCCLEIGVPTLPELVLLMQVPARRHVSFLKAEGNNLWLGSEMMKPSSTGRFHASPKLSCMTA